LHPRFTVIYNGWLIQHIPEDVLGSGATAPRTSALDEGE